MGVTCDVTLSPIDSKLWQRRTELQELQVLRRERTSKRNMKEKPGLGAQLSDQSAVS